ncbi:hypothetical protein BPAE_0015g00900 [Botrytis paeoniae]|uniref:Uncharacterized protein n=1 Tax=Botrytis paeoniae TaxID=278948 RepID=A0A4Z1G577_9HELO|nr:hypothetical protein BPAE_0015g00900 [Botrytis paeoniae]
MPPYEFNPRISKGRPNHPCNYLPAKKIIDKIMDNLQIEIYQTNQAPQKYGHGSETKDKYALAQCDFMKKLLFNDNERVRKEKEANQKRKDGEKSRKEQDKRLKKYGEPSGGRKEERHGLLDGSSRRH